uniref:succinate dehydrogenase subunit 4 n=1 Tax=Pseudoceramium tenerrimum TaxID=196911 RepID=UPI002E78DE05|nr:succinate dehydrogenase subunit 4 [Pseudoceramium tenerrimum]YP_011017853.1 succinate dehydrogenase subunit 4 [Pseudoceramium tenerrimum]WQF69712.1 succinate dehydrogenase subunit 4 [Pseudoceramium tenerrimum]WQF69729.1 succinate dehydrogenase subunit 4 [Pseudoceramium tenerrimum]WQF69748.1 succinate dehydrogenase subunit 4 [Pseudoceramium tenerrimum]WQF69765.1 succinate dehydrogenase subunit 4 [Pseudoceramium tenerrimum]
MLNFKLPFFYFQLIYFYVLYYLILNYFFCVFHFSIGLSSILNDYIYMNPVKIFFNCLLKVSSLEVLQYSIELLF